MHDTAHRPAEGDTILTSVLVPLAVFVIAALSCAVLILLLRPWLRLYALARPNARSSHREPTPQGGGIAVIGATLAVTALALAFTGAASGGFAIVAVCAVLLGLVGGIDDIHPLSPAPRLAGQAVAVAAVLAGAAPAVLIWPDFVPWPLQFALALLAGIWFVNLVNFMDGLDWMTVAGLLPLTLAGGIALLMLGEGGLAVLALALAGALVGFAPFNRPVARLFLGDVGSLPIGLLTGFLLYRLAQEAGPVPALILPLYYLADATLTLLRRAAHGERVWEAHRSHHYQRATDKGWRVVEVVGAVLAVNLALVVLAWLAWGQVHTGPALAALAASMLVVALLLRALSRPPWWRKAA
jgi:UDP-N-acetylmuramyl pentapeptide phosphotransferase/UDP-N-acetylglucosamine-1-phosphate transferase